MLQLGRLLDWLRAWSQETEILFFSLDNTLRANRARKILPPTLAENLVSQHRWLQWKPAEGTAGTLRAGPLPAAPGVLQPTLAKGTSKYRPWIYPKNRPSASRQTQQFGASSSFNSVAFAWIVRPGWQRSLFLSPTVLELCFLKMTSYSTYSKFPKKGTAWVREYKQERRQLVRHLARRFCLFMASFATNDCAQQFGSRRGRTQLCKVFVTPQNTTGSNWSYSPTGDLSTRNHHTQRLYNTSRFTKCKEFQKNFFCFLNLNTFSDQSPSIFLEKIQIVSQLILGIDFLSPHW